MGQRHFHFNLGPVQGFVAQARRTRDFWAGSFLLSWMAGVAMRAVEQQNGQIVFPTPPAEFMQALDDGGTGPRQGGVPNRFTATVPDDFDAHAVMESIGSVWQQLAEHVWQHDKLNTVDTDGTVRKVWDEQIAAFWDMTWAITDGEDYTVMDRRKNWRSHYPPAQGGAKCMIMAGWREMSGRGALPVRKRREFWQALRNQCPTDLSEGEQLCAVAYVKRRFARHFDKFSADAGGWTVCGWPVPTGVPSVAYIAASQWLADVLTHADSDTLWAFHDHAHDLAGDYGEWDSNLKCIRESEQARPQANRKWRALDGSLFFPATYDNPRLFSDRDTARAAAGELRALRQDTVPSPFYAVLAMDGDRLGALLASQTNARTAVSQALDSFTQRVPAIVDDHSGFLIYAGGDDVLALLPLETALDCAVALRRCYITACNEAGLDNDAVSISAGVHYAHYHAPLGRVLGQSHLLLDDVAKARTGRDAVAVQVSKPSGVACTWSRHWDEVLDDDHTTLRVQHIADTFAGRDDETPFSSRFFYRIRELLDQFNHSHSPLAFDDRVALLASRYLASGINDGRRDKLTMADAQREIQPLMELCRTPSETAYAPHADDAIHVDAALLIRFLASKGLSREYGQ